MLFKSRIDRDTKSNQELIIFCHAGERVLLPLPKTYEEGEQAVRSCFSLSGELIFETDDIDGFEETFVRIHPAAWEGISPVIRSVNIKLGNSSSPATASRPRPSETLSSGSRRLSSQKRMSSSNGTTAHRLSMGTGILAPAPRIAERQSVSARKTPIPTPSPKPTPIFAQKDAGPSRVHESPPLHHFPAPSSSHAKIEELEDEDEVPLPSPKKKSARPRIMSDYGVDQTEEEADDVLNNIPRGVHASEPDEEEELDQLDETDFASAGPIKSLQQSQQKAPRKSDGSIVELDGPPMGWVNKVEKALSVKQTDAPLSEPKMKATENLKAKVSAQLFRSEETRPTQAPKTDESFLIMIEYADDMDSRTLFKTRKRHAVSKVLMQACRTFGLEAYYHSAQLVLVVEEENEEGEIVYRRQYTCARDETMGEAGAEPNSKFLVEIVDENEEE